ncbi:MAG: VWA domain-containing protein [Sulfurovaceae bacterium]
MSFVYPQVFLFLLVPLLVLAYLIMTNKSKIDRLFESEVLKRLKVDEGSFSKRSREILFFAALIFMVIALARPVIYKGEKKAKIEGSNFLIALDISGSMRSEDVYPNRLMFAKQKIVELLKNATGDEVALAAFSKQAFVISPPSYDKATLIEMIKNVDTSYINQSATDFSSILDLVGEISKEKEKKKNLILFTDGGDGDSYDALITQAKDDNIVVYVVLVGTKKGAPVLDGRGEIYRDKEGSMVFTYANEDSFELAKNSGGIGVVASYAKSDILDILNSIHKGVKANKSISIKDQRELFYYPLGFALFVLLISLSSMPRVRS